MASQCTRIFDDNFVELDLLNAFSSSSEKTDFPKENALDGLRRTKLWRTDGAFDIRAGSNTIVFEETAATPLTATVVATTYTNITSLLAAIKVALEAVGGSTFTIDTDSSTSKIRFASDGAGGAGILNLLWSDAGSTAMGGILGFDTVDQTGALLYIADELRISNGEYLQFDLGISSNPGSFAFIASRNTPIPISPAATIRLQGNETTNFDNPTTDLTIPYNEEVIGLSSLTGLGTDAKRYWRMRIEDFENPNLFISVGFVFLGDFFTPSQGAVQFPFTEETIDRSTSIIAEAGQIFSDQRDQTDSFPFSFRFLTTPEKEDLKFIWTKFGSHTPFFISMDSDANFSTVFNKNLRYVKFRAQPRFQLQRPNLWAMTVDLLEVL